MTWANGATANQGTFGVIPTSTYYETSEFGAVPILVTKLHRPPVRSDLEVRSQLLELLDENRARPLTLISAPAGYGKSTLASMWLEANDCPSAWISLDEHDNDLHTFVSYLLAAISRAFPGSQLQSWNLLEASVFPPPRVVARYLLNDLDRIGEPFILALDDVYMIHEQPVFQLLDELLRHPARPLHLMLVTRRDPPLPIASMRARRQVTEIRSRHLRFTVPEARRFLTKMLQQEVDESTAAEWTELTEGWITALQLAALSFAHGGREVSFRADVTASGRYLQDYLTAEVLQRLDPGIRQRMLAVSLLDRFCGSLCEAVWPLPGAGDDKSIAGDRFLRWVLDHNLFLIPLDAQQQWFRFHHVFQHLLQNVLREGTAAADIAAIHLCASRWYAENGLIDEAIRYALAAHDGALATRLVTQNRYALMNTQQWQRLARWLRQLPDEIVTESAYLNSTKAMFEQYHGRTKEMLVHMKWAEEMLSSLPIDAEESKIVQAEITTLHGVMEAVRGQPAKANANGRRALQMQGNFDQSLGMFKEALDDPIWSEAVRPMIFHSTSINSFMEGDLARVLSAARESLQLSQRLRLAPSESFARYFLGAAHYLRNELQDAEAYLLKLVESRELGAPSYVAHGTYALACIHLARGNVADAEQAMETVKRHFVEIGHSDAYRILEAAEVELALRTGDLEEAKRRSARGVQYDLQPPIWFWYVRQLTPIKLLLAEGTPASLVDARHALESMDEQMAKIHRKTVRIDVLALLSLVCHAQGDASVAYAKLAKAVALAEPGGFIRNFVDMGRPMAGLLTQLRTQSPALAPAVLAHSDRILAAFDATSTQRPPTQSTETKSPATSPAESLAEPLTQREAQILRYLATELSPEEVARELSLTVSTVR